MRSIAPALFASLFLMSTQVVAETNKKSERSSKRLVERLRGPDQVLGKGGKSSVNMSSKRVFYASKTDDDVAVKRQQHATKKPKAKPAKSDFQVAMDRISSTVLAKRKRAKGRILVSFTIDSKGKPKQVMAIGFDAALDKELENLISGFSLPKKLRGQRVETTFYFNKGKVVRR
jgi:hypothetical protein